MNDDSYIHPSDGYRVELQTDNETYAAVVLFFVANGKCEWYTTLREFRLDDDTDIEPTDASRDSWVVLAKAKRFYNIWRALCSYLNAGGRMSDFIFSFVQRPRNLVVGVADSRVLQTLKKLKPLTPPEGFSLLSTGPSADVSCEHIFANEKDERAIVWCEDIALEMTDLRTLDELLSNPYGDEEDGFDDYTPAAEDTKLLDSEDTQAEGSD